jgi:hypothetical protein
LRFILNIDFSEYKQGSAPVSIGSTPASCKDSSKFKNGNSSVFKSNNSTTIYFGDEEQKDDDRSSQSTLHLDTTTTRNSMFWKSLNTNLASYHQFDRIEEEQKQLRESNTISASQKESIRKQINQVLDKAKNMHDQKSDQSNKTKMVIVRPEAHN